MKTKTEKNIHGIDCVIENYHDNGNVCQQFEWNHDESCTYVVKSFYTNGQLSFECEWNKDKTKTGIIKSFYTNGQLSFECEWNKDKTETEIIKSFYISGNIRCLYKWNEDRTKTTLVKEYEDITPVQPQSTETTTQDTIRVLELKIQLERLSILKQLYNDNKVHADELIKELAKFN
jgi:antitoxin component YwqK of YwqJK toxin-antitoxin module